MAIADRISAMYDHVGDIYDTLELGGDTTENKNIVNINAEIKREYKNFLAKGTDELWNNWEKVEGEGETLTLNNTMEGKMKVDLKGNTYQNGEPTPDTPIDIQVVSGDNTIKVEGKNLLNIPDTTKTTNGVTATSTNGIIKVQGTSTGTGWIYIPANLTLEAGTYTHSTNKSQLVSANIKIGSNFQVGYEVYNKTETLNTTTQLDYYSIQVVNGQSYDYTIQPQIEKGSTATSYTPYQSASYPVNLGNIELCKIGDYQDKIAKSTGKNLFDKVHPNIIHKAANNNLGIETNNYFVTIYLPAKEGDIFTLSSNSSLLDTYASIYFVSESVDTATTALSQTRRSGATSITATAPQNTKYVCFYLIYSINQTNINSLLETIQIEYGNTPTDFEPYGKVWYLNKQIGKVVLNGSESWAYEQETNYKRLWSSLSNSNTDSSRSVCLSNHFIYSNGNNVGTCFIFSSKIYLYPENNISSSSDFKTWLSTHNTEVYYPLATPTYTPITDTTLLSQLEALAYSYDEQTNISQVNDDLPSELDVVALEDI